MRAANRKQALVPTARTSSIRSAPRRRRRPGKPTVVVLPGPPRELQPMWPMAMRRLRCRRRSPADDYRQEMLRMFGLPESMLADALRDAEQRVGGFEGWRSPRAFGAAKSRW